MSTSTKAVSVDMINSASTSLRTPERLVVIDPAYYERITVLRVVTVVPPMCPHCGSENANIHIGDLPKSKEYY